MADPNNPYQRNGVDIRSRNYNLGEITTQNHLDLLNRNVGDMIRRNPALVKDPMSVVALAKAYDVDPNRAADYISSTKFLNAVHRSFWGNIAHATNTFYNGVNTFTTGVARGLGRALTDPMWDYQQVNTFSSHALSGLKNLGYGIVRPWLHPTNYAIEAGWDKPVSALGTPWWLVKKAGSKLFDMANMPPTIWAATASSIDKYGIAATLGDQMPAIIAGAMTDGAYSSLIGRELTASEAAATDKLLWETKIKNQVAADRAVINNVSDWSSLSSEQMAELAAANRRVNIMDPELAGGQLPEKIASSLSGYERERAALSNRLLMEDNPLAAEVGTARPYANAPSLADWFARNVEFIGRGMRKTIEKHRQLLAGVAGPGAQMYYMANAAMLSETHPEIWDKALKGQVIKADGHTTSVGDYIASKLAGEDNFFHTALAAIINIDLNFVVDDPLTKILKTAQMGRSMYGYTGSLGALFGGMAIRHPGDVYRAYSQYSSVRRAVDYIATHTSSEISKAFQNVFVGGKILHELGQASTPEEVLNIMERINYGMNMVFTKMPQMSWYSLFKDRLGGDLGLKYGFYGKLLERSTDIDPRMNEDLKAMTKLDWQPKDLINQRLNPAGKAKVLLRQRFRRQFMSRERWFNERTKQETTTRIEVGSTNAVWAMMQRMVINGADPLEARAWGDMMIANATDAQAYKLGYRNMMFKILTMKLGAVMPRAEFEKFISKMEDYLYAMTDNLIGVDGAGVDGAFIATEIDGFNMSIRDGKIRRGGVGVSHLGQLRLPDSREIRNIQNQLAVIYQDLASEESYKLLAQTDYKFDEVVQLAEFSVLEPEKIMADMKRMEKLHLSKGANAFETENITRGYMRGLAESISKYEKMLTVFQHKGNTAAERIANVVIDLDGRANEIKQLIAAEKNGFDMRADLYARRFSLPETVFNELNMTPEEIRIQNLATAQHLEELIAEQRSIEDVSANIKAMLNKSPQSEEEIKELAKFMGAVRDLRDEALSKYVKDFQETVRARKEGKSYGTGRRNLRSRGQLITDWVQFWVNNRYFKPLSLTSPAWATRVSMSEAMLNGMRIGGMNFFEAHVASSLAKHEFRMGKYAKLPKEEQSLLRNVLGGIMMGLERGLLDVASDAAKGRLVDDAVSLMIRHDGHLPMGVHGTNGVDDYNVEDGMMEQGWGLDSDFSTDKDWYVRGQHGVVKATEPGAGTAFHENLMRIADDQLLGPIAREVANAIRLTGMDLFDAEMDKLMPAILREARQAALTGTGKIMYAKREEKLNQLLDQWSNWSDFKNANDQELARIIDLIEAEGAKTLEDVTAEMVPASMRDGFVKNAQFLSKLMETRAKIDSEIAAQEAEVTRLRDIAESTLAVDMDKAAEAERKLKLKEVAAQQKALEQDRKRILKEIEKHPYAAMVGTIEGGAALNAYKKIQKDFIEELKGTVAEHLDETAKRLNELLGGNKVVVPRGGYAEMAGERFLVFTDEEGNVVPNSSMWETVAEKYPQLWSDNDTYKSFFPLGMPGAEGVDALAAVLGTRPALFASYSNDLAGRKRFIEDYTKHSAALRSRNITRDKRFAESWMIRNISSNKADWKLDAAEVWDRKAAMDVRTASPSHGLSVEEWFDEVIPMVQHHESLRKASLFLSLSDQHRKWFEDAYKELKGIDPVMMNNMRDMPRLFDESFDGTSAFSVRGVPLEVILGPGKKAKDALNDFAFHMRERVMLQDTKIFDRTHIPHYTPDAAGMKRFIEDWERHTRAINDHYVEREKLSRTAETAARRDERALEAIAAREARVEGRFGDSAAGGAREFAMAKELFPALEHSFATLLSRLKGDYTLIKDLHIGQSFNIGYVNDATKDFLREVFGADYPLRSENNLGEIITGLDQKVVLTYAEAGKFIGALEKRVGDFDLNATVERIRNEIYDNIDKEHEAAEAAGEMYHFPGFDVSDDTVESAVRHYLGMPAKETSHGPIVGMHDAPSFRTEGFPNLLAGMFEDPEIVDKLEEYLATNKFSNIPFAYLSTLPYYTDRSMESFYHDRSHSLFVDMHDLLNNRLSDWQINSYLKALEGSSSESWDIDKLRVFAQDVSTWNEKLTDYLLRRTGNKAGLARYNIDNLYRETASSISGTEPVGSAMPIELMHPEYFGLDIRRMARIAAESGSASAADIVAANGWQYDRYIPFFDDQAPPPRMLVELKEGNLGVVGEGVTGRVYEGVTHEGDVFAIKVMKYDHDPGAWNEANIEEAVSAISRILDLPARGSAYYHFGDTYMRDNGGPVSFDGSTDFVVHPYVTPTRDIDLDYLRHTWSDSNDVETIQEAYENGDLTLEQAKSIRAMNILDALITNSDRHGGNIMVNLKGEIVAVDHSHAEILSLLSGHGGSVNPYHLNLMGLTESELAYLDRRINQMTNSDFADVSAFKQAWNDRKKEIHTVDDSAHELSFLSNKGFIYKSGFNSATEQMTSSDLEQYADVSKLKEYRQLSKILEEFSTTNGVTLGQMRKASEASDQLQAIAKPRWEQDKQYVKNDGTLPETLRYLPGDFSQEDLFGGIRKTFTSSTARRLFGVSKPSSMVQGVAVKNLNSKLLNEKKFVKTVLSYEDNALVIKSMSYDPSSAAQRRKAIASMKAIMETADNYRMPIKIVVAPEGPEGVSAAIRNLDAWFGSFGFTGKPDKYSEKIVFTRSPSGYGKRELVDAEAKPVFKQRLDELKARMDQERAAKYAVPEDMVRANEQAQKWFATFVDPIASGAHTPMSVWRRAMDIDRNRVADQLNRDGYQELLQQLADNGQARVRAGSQRGAIQSRAGMPASATQSAFEAEVAKAEEALQKKLEQSARLDERINTNFAARDKVRQRVLKQQDRLREHQINKSVEFYARRERNGKAGMGKVERAINNNLGGINTAIEREVSRLINKKVLEIGAQAYGGTNINELRKTIEDIAYTRIKTMDPELRKRFDRDEGLLPDELTTGDPHMDFAKAIAEHLIGLSSARYDVKPGRELFPEIISAMETGDSPGPKKLSDWLGERKRNGEGLPGPFPARKFASPYDKGSRASLLQRVSDKSHQQVLGPIVNELVREPMFVWEYHTQMEALRPFVSAGWLTQDQAEVKAEVAASINMMKYVHNPQDKLVWEHNWRVLAPFYFAKNQAMRRALRVAGDNLAAFEKYLKLNLAVTDFVAQSVTSIGNNYNIPGSQLVAGFSASLVGSIIMGIGYHGGTMTRNTFGYDASPSSVTSIVVTGQEPGLSGILKELIHIPFGMAFTVPAKFIYESVFRNSGLAYDMMRALLGDVSMRSSLLEDLMPNSFMRNTVKGGLGYFLQDAAGSFQSTETWVIADIADQQGEKFYEAAKKRYPILSEDDLAKYGSKEELWYHYALQDLTAFYANKDNLATLQAEAKYRTAVMWITKTVGSFILPVAVNVGERFYSNKDFYKIANEKDVHGELKYPSLQMVSDEFARRHPDKIFAIMSHTKSTGTSYLEVSAATRWIKENSAYVEKYPLLSAYLIPYGKKNTFDPEALRIEMAMNLRERFTVKDFLDQLQVMYGDRYYSSMELKYKLDPMSIDMTSQSGYDYVQALQEATTPAEKLKVATGRLGAGVNLTYNAYKNLEDEAKRYASKENATWWKLGHHDIERKQTANAAFEQLKTALKDPSTNERLTEDDRRFYEEMLKFRAQYVSDYKQYKQAGYSTSMLSRDYYNQCNNYAADPKYEKHISFIYGVMRRLTDPMQR